ncbi:hypothetical protein P7C73_g302, partial [Tremellales sp. Uapishka_1]
MIDLLPPTQHKEGYQHVTDAYIRYTDVVFEWYKNLDPWQSNAHKALLSREALTHPEHPLRGPSDEGIRLFYAKSENGVERLLFSLRQVEYLQYYIHEMQLADPHWVMELASRKASTEVAETVHKPEDCEEWIPLPADLVYEKQYTSLESIVIPSASALHSLVKHTAKSHRSRKKSTSADIDNAYTEEQLARAIARQENMIPGPGLGNPSKNWKKRQDERREKEVRREERRLEAEGRKTGWGGFPLAEKVAKEIDDETKSSDLNPVIVDFTKDTVRGGLPTPPLTSGDEDSPASDHNDSDNTDGISPPKTEPFNPEELQALGRARAAFHAPEGPGAKSAAPKPEIPDPKMLLPVHEPVPPSPSDTEEENEVDEGVATEAETTPTIYHCQQALIVASAGGLSAMYERPADADGEKYVGPPKEIGRSLFISLKVVSWEQDPSVILEVGWNAVWWQEKRDWHETVREVGPDGNEKAEEDRFEVMRDGGHWTVQDRLLSHQNGLKVPNHRANYMLGASLPIQAKDLRSTVIRKVVDLKVKSGKGPTYMITHKPDGGIEIFNQIGLSTKGWYEGLYPAEFGYPSYASPDGPGKTFVINTAELFAAIEFDPAQADAPASMPEQSRKSLEEISWIMFGSDEDKKPIYFANAGNSAFFNLEVFLAIASPSAATLDILRADYRVSQNHPPPVDLAPTPAPLRNAVAAPPSEAQDEDDEYDSDPNTITGVYHEVDGKLVLLNLDDSDSDTVRCMSHTTTPIWVIISSWSHQLPTRFKMSIALSPSFLSLFPLMDHRLPAENPRVRRAGGAAAAVDVVVSDLLFDSEAIDGVFFIVRFVKDSVSFREEDDASFTLSGVVTDSEGAALGTASPFAVGYDEVDEATDDGRGVGDNVREGMREWVGFVGEVFGGEIRGWEGIRWCGFGEVPREKGLGEAEST